MSDPPTLKFLHDTQKGAQVTIIEILQRYFEAVSADGDWLNDWLSWLPYWMRSGVRQAGIALEQSLIAAGHYLNN